MLEKLLLYFDLQSALHAKQDDFKKRRALPEPSSVVMRGVAPEPPYRRDRKEPQDDGGTQTTDKTDLERLTDQILQRVGIPPKRYIEPDPEIFPKHAPVIPQYLAVCLGVIAEPFLRNYVEQGAWSLDIVALAGRIAFGLIIGVMILPGVYKASFDPSKPITVQLAALFPLGIGWQSFVTFGAKIATG